MTRQQKKWALTRLSSSSKHLLTSMLKTFRLAVYGLAASCWHTTTWQRKKLNTLPRRLGKVTSTSLILLRYSLKIPRLNKSPKSKDHSLQYQSVLSKSICRNGRTDMEFCDANQRSLSSSKMRGPATLMRTSSVLLTNNCRAKISPRTVNWLYSLLVVYRPWKLPPFSNYRRSRTAWM